MEGRYASNLLNADSIVMQQVRTMFVSDYDILDIHGNPIAHVATTTSGGSLFFMGAREFLVSDPTGPLCVIQDPPDFGLDRFEAFLPDGRPLAHITQQFRFFQTAISIEVAGGNVMELSGNVFNYSFDVMSAGVSIAQATREWGKMEHWLLGKDRYVVHLDPNMPPNYRLALVAGLVALNQILEKKADS